MIPEQKRAPRTCRCRACSDATASSGASGGAAPPQWRWYSHLACGGGRGGHTRTRARSGALQGGGRGGREGRAPAGPGGGPLKPGERPSSPPRRRAAGRAAPRLVFERLGVLDDRRKLRHVPQHLGGRRGGRGRRGSGGEAAGKLPRGRRASAEPARAANRTRRAPLAPLIRGGRWGTGPRRSGVRAPRRAARPPRPLSRAAPAPPPAGRSPSGAGTGGGARPRLGDGGFEACQ